MSTYEPEAVDAAIAAAVPFASFLLIDRTGRCVGTLRWRVGDDAGLLGMIAQCREAQNGKVRVDPDPECPHALEVLLRLSLVVFALRRTTADEYAAAQCLEVGP